MRRCCSTAPWLGRLLAAETAAHLAAVNLGLKSIPVERRRHRDREIRLLAIAQGLIAAAEIGLRGQFCAPIDR
ncbi:DUF1612 domain-containing protein [Rhizobium beringeri]|uniref:DUF1612 domain-containing protein n=1 Tax=Rhizobium beringeri TaxID=3019934 RepID=UPI00398EC194